MSGVTSCEAKGPTIDTERGARSNVNFSRRSMLLLGLVVGLPACTSDEIRWLDTADAAVQGCQVAGSTAQFRDSSGVWIAEHPDVADAPTVNAELALTITGWDSAGRQPFGRALGVVASNGAVLLADSATSELFLVDSLGANIRRIGRDGEGPGDFRRLGRLFLLGADSIGISDQKGTRLTVLSPDGTVLRIGRLRGIQRSEADIASRRRDPGVTTLAGRMSDGTFLGIQRVIELELPDGMEVGQPVARFTTGWITRIDERTGSTGLLREVTLEGNAFYQHDDGISFGPVLFSPIASASASAADEGYWYSSGRDFRVDRFTVDGELRQSIRLCREPRAVSEADVHHGWQQWAMDEGMESEYVPGTPVPRTFPAWVVHSFTTDSLAWMESQGPVDEDRTWWVFRSDGTLLSRMRMPAGRQVYSVGNGSIVAIVPKGHEDERVEVYRTHILDDN